MKTETSIAVGIKAPAFTLVDQDNNKRKLSDFAGKWVVLYFYPKDDTPGCTTEACEFTDGIKAFEKLNATVIGVSPDSVASHQKFIAKHKLSVILLCDADRKVALFAAPSSLTPKGESLTRGPTSGRPGTPRKCARNLANCRHDQYRGE